MAIHFDTIRGMQLGVEFPGMGIYCALNLFIFRITFINKHLYEILVGDDDEN